MADDADVAGAVLAAALEAFVSIDADGRVVAWNPAAESTFGWTRDEAVGEPIEDLIIPLRYRQAHREGLTRLAATGRGRILGQRLSLAACHREGYQFPIEMTLTATSGPQGPRYHAFVQDVTVAQRARRFAAVEAAVSRELAEATGSGEATQRVVQALGVTLGWPVIELWLADEARQVLGCCARWFTPNRDLTDFIIDELEPGLGLPGMVWGDGKPLWVPDLPADSRFPRSRIAASCGLHAAVGIPIRSGGHVLGVLAIYGDSVEEPEDGLLTLLGGLAAHVGQFLERRRAEELTIELARTRDEFVALVSHELRGPLTIITSAVSLLSEEDDLPPAEHRRYLATIERSAQRLTVMVDDLLDLARLESAQPTVHPQQTDLGKIIQQAVDAVESDAAAHHLTVEVNLPAAIPMYADGGRLRQVADNLLSNAVKYTPDGGRITLSASVEGDTVRWTVTDTGIGVPEAERVRLFRRFYRASTALERRIPGTGLGLVITRAIVERHHGTIDMVDRPGPGTTFEIRLPTQPPGQWP